MPQTLDLRPGGFVIRTFANNAQTINFTFDAGFDMGVVGDWTVWIAPSPTSTHLYNITPTLDTQTLTVVVASAITSTLRNTSQILYVAKTGQVLLGPDIFFDEDAGAATTDTIEVAASGDVAVTVVSVGGGGNGTVVSVVAGDNIDVDDTDPANPIVSATAGGGIVETIVAGSNITVDDTDPANPIVSSTGGGGGGGIQHIAVPIAFDTPGLSSPSGDIPGVTLYTPSVGDILFDGWIEVSEAWDPFAYADFYLASTTGPAGNSGAFANAALPATPLAVDVHDCFDGDAASHFLSAANGTMPTLGWLSYQQAIDAADASLYRRIIPGVWAVVDPLVLVVSDDGRSNGNDPGLTQGTGIVHLLIIPAS